MIGVRWAVMSVGLSLGLSSAVSALPAVTGRVVDGAGKPVAGALVMVADPKRNGGFAELPPTAAVWITTGADGSFHLSPSEPGTYHLDITAQGFAPLRRPALVLNERGRTLTLGALTLDSEAVLEGRVVDLGRRPIVGAEISLYLRGWVPSRLPAEVPQSDRERLRKQPSAVSDAEGYFAVHALIPGETFQLVIAAEGFATYFAEGQRAPVTAPLEAVLRNRGIVRGEVVDSEGKPVAGIRVDAMAEGLAERGTTDELGRFRFGAGPGAIELRTVGEGTSSTPIQLQLAPGQESQPLRIVLTRVAPEPPPPPEPIQEVSGQVVDEQGVPLAEVYVQAYRNNGQGWGTAMTESGGGFFLPSLPRGDYRLSAGKRGYLDTRLETLEVGERPVTGLRLILERGAVVTGRVLGLSPALLPGMQVWVNPDWANSSELDSEGRFRIEAVKARPASPTSYLVLDLQRRQRINWALTVLPGETEVVADLDLTSAVRVTGRLSRGGQSLAGWVEARPDVEGSLWKTMARTGEDGAFELLGMAPGTYWLNATTVSGELLDRRKLEVREDLHLDLEVGASGS